MTFPNPLTAEQRAKGQLQGHTPEARRKAARRAAETRTARNALTWLKHTVENSKAIPPAVKTRAKKLFADVNSKQPIHRMTEEEAQREADRISTRIHQARAQYVLLTISEQDKGYLAASKVAATWLLIDRKLNSTKAKGKGPQTSRRQVPTTATRQSANGHDEADQDPEDRHDET